MALKGSSTEEKIWNYLIDKGLNPYGVAGLMGNLYWESGLNPLNLENTYEKKLGYTDGSYTAAVDSGQYTNFTQDKAGYGLAQWTYYARKAGLLTIAKTSGRSVGDLECQLDFLWKELSQDYTGVLRVLKSATSVKEASDVVLTQFERPANMGDSVKKQRADKGQQYYARHAERLSDAPTAPKTNGVTINTPITTAAQLAAKAVLVAQNYKTLYVMGCIGAPLTPANKNRYTTNHSYNKSAVRTALIKAASSDTFGFDCVCLIKSLLWGWNGDLSKTYGGAQYASHGVPDINADSMIKVCKDVSTNFNQILVGEALWTDGHIGIYVGDGLAVECTPAWLNRVQITACNRDVYGYPRRNWKKHGKLPYVAYETTAASVIQATPAAAKEETKPTQQTPAPAKEEAKPVQQATKTVFKTGDIVMFTAKTHYLSASSKLPKGCKPGRAVISAIYPTGKHPYHLINIKGGGSTVYGWVDEGTFKKI